MPTWQADDGADIHYQLLGQADGDSLLLLPGLLGAIETQWQAFIPDLARSHRLIVVDLRGHGRSTNAALSLDPQRMVDDLVGLLDFLQAPGVHVAGYSLGGYLGLMLHLQQPRRVQTLLMHATKFYWTPEAVASMQRQLDPEALAERVPKYAGQLAREHGARLWRALVRQSADLVAHLAEQGVTERQAATAQCPVLVSVGDNDELVHLPEAQRLSRLLPRGQLLVLPGVRHPFPTIRRIPFLPVMQAFHGASGLA